MLLLLMMVMLLLLLARTPYHPLKAPGSLTPPISARHMCCVFHALVPHHTLMATYKLSCVTLRSPSEVQRTSVKRNDGSPRWLETFDFVMVSAGSMLTLNVCNKVTLLDAVASIKLNKVRRGAHCVCMACIVWDCLSHGR
jgi:C2 domain